MTMAESYGKHLKTLITKTEERSDIDPDSFAVDIGLLEKELDNIDRQRLTLEKKVTYKSILHGVLATAYQSLRQSDINVFNDEVQEEYDRKSQQHFSRVLDDKATLSRQNSKEYEPLITIQDGGTYYGHNMLAVMLDFVLKNNLSLSRHDRDSLHFAARRIFQLNGDRNSDTMLRIKELQYPSSASDEDKQAYCRTLEALYDSTRDIAAGKLVKNKLDLAVGRIMSKRIDICIAKNILANKPFELQISSTNATDATLRIFQYHGDEDDRKDFQQYRIGKLLDEKTYRLSTAEQIENNRRMYLPTRDTVSDTRHLPVGKYLFKAYTEEDSSQVFVQITSLHMLVFHMPDSTTRIKMVDRITGMPQQGITVILYPDRRDKNKYVSMLTDKNGEVTFSDGSYQWARATRDPSKCINCDEDATELKSLAFYDYRYRDETVTHGTVLTDRGIYRPGQTVHVSSMIYNMLGDSTWVKTSGRYIVKLDDPDGETVATDTLSPDNMGTMSSEFMLPKGKLGWWQISIRDVNAGRWNYIASTSVKVEEYKRPSYSIEFPKDTTVYSIDDNINIQLNAKTFSGIPVQEADVQFTVEACKQRFWFYRTTGWEHVALIETTTNSDGQALFDITPVQKDAVMALTEDIQDNDKLLLRITATATDKAGESHQTTTTYLIPLKPSQKTDTDKKPDPLQVSTEKIHAGETLGISFTPKHDDAYIFYYVVANHKVIDSYEGTVGKTIGRKLQCTKQWGDGANIYAVYVKDGIIYQHSKTVKVPKPDKKLNLSWHTFRDHLTPGQEEKWTLIVKDKDDKPVKGANLLASMYDASLDEFSTFQWTFGIPFSTRLSRIDIRHSTPTPRKTLSLHYTPSISDLLPDDYDNLDRFDHTGGNMVYDMVYERSSPRLMAVSKAGMEFGEFTDYGDTESAPNGKIAGLSIEDKTEDKIDETDESTETTPPTVPLRANFNETAFFYPNITTDANGQAEIKFTLPESLTQWKFLGFAHTDDVRYGIISATAVANKDFMVQPQMPRFIRTNDETTIQARIQNQSEQDISGSATMRLLLASDETVIVMTQTQPFSVEGGKAGTVTFSIGAGRLTDDVICEIYAYSRNCSDGERNLLPVLSAKEHITENIPFYIEGATTKEVDLSTLYNSNSKTATERTMEIGYTDNPALDVFRALRATQMPSHDNAPCYAAALYSNTVMLDIASQLSTYSDTLISNFDKQQALNQARLAEEKLQELQLDDGSWSWFKGMEGSPYITLAVAEHLCRLHDMTSKTSPTTENMRTKAMGYLDRYMQKDFQKRKENKWSLTPDEFDLRYMAICDIEENEMLTTYLREMAKSMKQMTIYGRAKGACILQKFSRRKDATKFAESVKHYLVYKPGFGRYFATDIAYYSWQDYRLPTQLAAMRCLAQVEGDKNSLLLPDMQVWLLRQKQTQLWRNPLNAIDAADFLLTYSKDESLRQPDTPSVRVSPTAQPIQIATPTPLPPSDVASSISVEKHSTGISWGYVRATFLEDAEKLDNYTTGELSIQQKFYIKQGKDWLPLDSLTALAVGSTIRIRNIIHADRDMDFVSVATKHPACLEPTRTQSGYMWLAGRGGYIELHDTETDIFFDRFTRGTTTVDIEYYVNRSGTYHSGISTVTCEYAPEFGGYAKQFNLNIAQ